MLSHTYNCLITEIPFVPDNYKTKDPNQEKGEHRNDDVWNCKDKMIKRFCKRNITWHLSDILVNFFSYFNMVNKTYMDS